VVRGGVMEGCRGGEEGEGRGGRGRGQVLPGALRKGLRCGITPRRGGRRPRRCTSQVSEEQLIEPVIFQKKPIKEPYITLKEASITFAALR